MGSPAPNTILTRDWWASDSFRVFAPHIKAVAAFDVRAGNSSRLELRASAPPSIVAAALTYEAHCVSCHRPIHPFRARRAVAKRGRGIGGIYLGVSCALSTGRMGCARGLAAAAAYDGIEALLAGMPTPSVRQPVLL